MKFHKQRTVTSSPIEGLDAYEDAFADGRLERVKVYASSRREEPGVWRVLSVSDVSFRDDEATEPLEVSDVTVLPRALVVDELTRHRTTRQLFIPITGSFMAVVAGSKPHDPDAPDPASVTMVPVLPGEAFEVGVGTWHTLPYVFSSPVVGLSVMHRETLDAYHDVRDLAAEGWVGVLTVEDPEEM